MKRILALVLTCIVLTTMVPAMAESELTTIKVIGYDKAITFGGNTYYLSDLINGKIKSIRYDMLNDKLTEIGVKLEYDVVTDDQYDTYLRTKLASAGGIDADIYCIRPLDDATRLSMASDGYFLPIDELYPYSDGTIQNYLENDDGKYLMAYQSINDKLYWISNIEMNHYEDIITGNYQVYLLRLDWVEKLGIEVPATLDELYDFAVACHTLDVNGNGVSDEMIHFPATPGPAAAWFGIGDEWYYLNDDNKFTSPWYEEGWKDYLVFVKKLQDAGVLEITTASNTLETENKLVGKTNWVSRNATHSVPEGQPTPMYTPLMIKPYEDKPAYIITQSGADVTTRSFAINANTDKKEAIAKLLDWTFTEDFTLLEGKGHPDLEGITWKRDPETGLITNADLLEGDDYDNLAATFNKNNALWQNILPKRSTNADQKAASLSWAKPNQDFLAGEYGFGYPYTRLKTARAAACAVSTEEEAEIIADYTTDLETYMNELATKLVLGEKSFDDWDSYLKDMEQLGLNKVLEVYQAKYDRAQAALDD